MIVSFSATAPQFLPEHERVERDQLSFDEKKQIEDDIRGIETVFEETEEMRSEGKRRLLDALEAIPPCKKIAYLEARKRCSDLVDKESDLVKFLRCEDYDAKVS